MANDLNRVILVGRLTRDPEFKTINGNSLVNFSLATNRTYSVQGSRKEETHYFDCEAWGKLADIIRKYTSKGKQVLVEGRLKQDTWESDGKKMSRIRIVTENLQLLGSSGGGAPSSGGYPSSQESEYPGSGYSDSGSSFESYDSTGATDDDMPF
jgi:single-strand DNA-binding protein